MNVTQISETLRAENYLIQDFDGKIIYTGDIVLWCTQHDCFLGITEYGKYKDEYCLMLHSPLIPYNCYIIQISKLKTATKYLFKKHTDITYLRKDLPLIQYNQIHKIYKGVLYRSKWNDVPNIIEKNTATIRFNNFEHFKDYNKYNVYILLNKNNTEHYEFLFRGDLENIPF
jgi:hypothetical protein